MIPKLLLVTTFALLNFTSFCQIKVRDTSLNEFEKFKLNQKLEFKEFKDKRDEEFANLLKNQWKTFELLKGDEPTIVPMPPIQPDKLPPAPIQLNKNLPKLIQPVQKKVNPIDTSKIKVAFSEKLPLTTEINFYNKNIEINYLKKFQISHTSLDEKGISDYWGKLSDCDYELFLNQLKQISFKLTLNDWANYELVSKISKKILTDESDQILFCFFILNHWGYDAKVGRRKENIVLLLPFENIIYKKSFLILNNKKFYIMNDDVSGLIQSFEQNFSNTNKKLDLKLYSSPMLGLDYTSKTLFLKNSNKSIKIRYNSNLINFKSNYPSTELDVFFTSMVDPITENDLFETFSPLLKDKNELDAVNILLDFVENSFEYKTDIDQFGYEKFYFPEDIFYYKYSDCEDRAVLFSYLVKTLLKLEVIGLEYKTHVATAVKFNSNIIGDNIVFNNKTYIICDPTYIGSSAGMCMPQFKNEKPTIIKIRVN